MHLSPEVIDLLDKMLQVGQCSHRHTHSLSWRFVLVVVILFLDQSCPFSLHPNITSL